MATFIRRVIRPYRLETALNASGFTLIEVVVVLAISGMLAVIAFTGQRALRSQAQFDTAIDKVVASVADAHNQATAGVNTTAGPQAGTGATRCAGGQVGQYVFAGLAWSADNSASPVVQYDYYEALPGATTLASACKFQTSISLGGISSLKVNATNPPPLQGGRILFIRDNKGALLVCPMANLTTDVRTYFINGGCSAGSMTLTFTDADGHKSQVQIDASGLAKRLN